MDRIANAWTIDESRAADSFAVNKNPPAKLVGGLVFVLLNDSETYGHDEIDFNRSIILAGWLKKVLMNGLKGWFVKNFLAFDGRGLFDLAVFADQHFQVDGALNTRFERDFGIFGCNLLDDLGFFFDHEIFEYLFFRFFYYGILTRGRRHMEIDLIEIEVGGFNGDVVGHILAFGCNGNRRTRRWRRTVNLTGFRYIHVLDDDGFALYFARARCECGKHNPYAHMQDESNRHAGSKDALISALEIVIRIFGTRDF